ncbi:MAG: FtsW/RodA/SpoVE family cell cycle protein [Anaerolinea sp.]|nr:FtsW/RodA/SpoVE family cell cycle protein [Anaerolinea sp.]MCC6975201.1 FtsW/RodA/SpoVE family cell cycle protein [Anaerolineae bacterium]
MNSLPQFIDDLPDEEELLEKRASERRRLFTASVDTYLLLTVGILVAIGLMMVWSTTFYWSEPQSAIFLQQLRNAFLGFVVMSILALIDYRLWRRMAIPMMGVTILLLAAVLVVGDTVFGARRAFFGGAVQPAEVAALVVVIYMSAWLTSKQTRLKNLTYGLLPFALLVGIVAGLILMEPDISTAVMVLATASIMFFLAGADWRQLGIAFVAFVIVGLVAISQFDYARARVESFFDLLRDPLTANDHAQAAIIGFLNGGIGGVGLGESRQKFEQLPTPHTDSIFAVIGEELGLAGCALVVGLYVVLMVRGFRIAKNAPDLFGGLLASGITVSIVVEALFNIAVMASVVPFTGVPLPFISFGGSSLVSSLASMGILISISRATVRKSVPTRKVNETLSLPGMRATISRVRQKPTEG